MADLETYSALSPRRIRKLIRFMEGQLEANPTDRYRAELEAHLSRARAALKGAR